VTKWKWIECGSGESKTKGITRCLSGKYMNNKPTGNSQVKGTSGRGFQGGSKNIVGEDKKVSAETPRLKRGKRPK